MCYDRPSTDSPVNMASLLYPPPTFPPQLPPFRSHSSIFILNNPNFGHNFSRSFGLRRATVGRASTTTMAASSVQDGVPATKLVTFLGKGGSGKTTAAVLAAQHYAALGLSTCLVTHSQDSVAEFLLNCKMGTTPLSCGTNLCAVKLETTNMLLEPLSRMKQADARARMTQGVLEGIVGEELGVLPGMDSIFALLALQRFIGFLGKTGPTNQLKERYDVTIYDGISSIETLRMLGAASSARLYLKYLRSVAEKTDFGRLAGPSILRLVDEAIGMSGTGGSTFDGKLSSEIWDSIERLLERGSSIFTDPRKFGCYLMTDPWSTPSVNTALRLWGCAIQSGAQISGVFAVSPPSSSGKATELENVKNRFLPLPLAIMPNISMDSPPDWKNLMVDSSSKDARDFLQLSASNQAGFEPTVKFDRAQKSVTLFMPGFDKSEIKLYQYRGGSELLVEAGDQRRVIQLPREVQGKVAGAKFIERSLVVTMR